MRYVKTLAAVSAAVAMLAWGVGPSVAADQAAHRPAGTHVSSNTPRAEVHAVTGTVSAVQPTARTIEVKVARGKEHLLVGALLTDQTVIKEGKTGKSLTDLKVGDHVWMKFQRGSSGDIAKTIVIKPMKKRS